MTIKNATDNLNDLSNFYSTSFSTMSVGNHYSKQSFRHFSKRDPCPICNGENACRQGTVDTNFFQCNGEANARKGEIVLGVDGNQYICVAEARGHTASFKPHNGNSSNYKPREVVRTPKIEVKSNVPQLADDELHRLYERVISELPFPTGKAEEKLLARGYTKEQIRENKIRLLPKWFKPSFPLPQAFPGQIWVKDKSDRVLGRHKEFIFIPIINDGKICAATLEDLTSDASKGEGKYRRHSSNDFPFHRDGEQPIQVYLPDGNHKQVWLGIEGGAHKPILFHLKSGLPVIAGMGCNISSSPKAANEAIAKAKAKYGDDVEFIGMVPDAGSILNPTVINAYKKNIQVFENLGIKSNVAWWGQASKDNSDIDELEDYSAIEFISPEAFFALVPEKPEKTEAAGFSTMNVENEKRKSGDRVKGSYKTKVRKTPDWLNWINKNKYTPDVIIKGEGDLKPSDIPDIEGKNVLFCAGLGTNKTGASLGSLKAIEDKKGICTILLSYINSLLHQTGDRGRQIGKDFAHIQSDDDGKMLSKDSQSNVSACVHSLGYVDGHFSDRNVFVDEIESVLQTLVSGANLGNHHGDIVEMFFRGLRNSWGNLYTDGNLTDLLVELIEKLTGKPTVKIKYEQETIRRKNFEFIISLTKKGKDAVNDPSVIAGKILHDIRAGKKVFITTDSRMFGESVLENTTKITVEEKAIDSVIEAVKKSGYKVFILSKKTSGTEEGKKFLANPGQYIIDNQIDLFIGTPSIGSGVSVLLPDDYFDAQYTVFCGVLSTKQQKQLLARLRNNLLNHRVYCPIKSMVKDRNRPQQYSASDFQRTYEDLRNLGKAFTIQDVLSLAEKAQSRINPDFDKYSAEMGALDNFEQDNLLECLTYSLEAEGHNITLVYENADEVAREETKEAKTKIEGRESEAFKKVEAFESTLEAESITKGNPTPENHLRKDKTYFLDKLPGIDQKTVWSVEFVLKYVITDSQQKAINAIIREFMLRNFDIAQEKHNLKMLNNAQKKHPVGKDLLPGDFGILWALNKLCLLDVINAEQFTCKSPLIQKVRAMYESSKDLQRLLKLKVPGDGVKDTSIAGLIKPLLMLLGMKTEEVCKTKVDGVQYSAYKVVSVIEENDRAAIYDCISHKWAKWQEGHELDRQLESVKAQDTQAVDVAADDGKNWNEEIAAFIVTAYQDRNIDLVKGYLQCITDGHAKYKEIAALAKTHISDWKESLEFGSALKQLWDLAEVQDYIKAVTA